MHVYVTCFYSCKHLLLIESCTRPVKRTTYTNMHMDNRTKERNTQQKKKADDFNILPIV